MLRTPILAIPPFPGARPPRFAAYVGDGAAGAACEDLLAALAKHRVGGCYWGKQKELPDSDFVLDGTGDIVADAVSWRSDDDPWHLLARAKMARLREDDPRVILALAADVPLILLCANGTVRDAGPYDAILATKALLRGWRFFNPFDGSDLTPIEAIELCGFWRELIDANRRIHSVMGIAYWKKPTVTPLLWAGADVPYNRSIRHMPQGAAVAIWRSRISAGQAREIENKQVPVIEIEDGFIRSKGLGADCVPPLSIIVDALGPHFAPGAPSELETILENGQFPPELIERARRLRKMIVAGGLSKYEAGAVRPLARLGGERRHVLVPGQVEDDRAVTSGGALPSNLELLRRARAAAGPEAFLIYKPHPDVLAGHRKGAIAEHDVTSLADRVDTESPMPALIEMVDELHVNSSLAGFEALLREKTVTVHGVPFYAGWGLTIDLGPVPNRRTKRRTLDELISAALLLYPRCLEPQTRLPCPVEVLVDRLSAGVDTVKGFAAAVVVIRRALGRVNLLLKV